MTTVYLVRHSEEFKLLKGKYLTKDSIQLINEKSPLSYNGEKLAENFSKKKEFENIDVVWSSNYVRAMSTAKYFSVNNNLLVNVDDRLGERVFGINSWDDLPIDFAKKQFNDENFKIGFGESQKDVSKRMKEALFEIINNYQNKRIVIVSHSTALMFLFKFWCNIEYEKSYIFKNEIFFNGNWDFCESFKLIFDNENLISIENIE